MQRRNRLSIALSIALCAGAMFTSNILVASWRDGLTAAAESGDARAQRQLGEALLSGDGRTANSEQGLAWLNMAAEKDDAIAHYALYRYFQKEARTPGERDLTFKHMRRAAALGHTGAITAMGKLYLTRSQDPQLSPDDANNARAAGLQLIERASEAGNPDAANQLGELYARGLHVPADRAKAISAFERADDARGHFRLYQLHIDQAKPDAAEEIKIAYAHLHHAGSKGHPEALALIMDAYENGTVVERSLEMAESWAAFAVESGVRSAAADQRRISALRHSEAMIAQEASEAEQAAAQLLADAEAAEAEKAAQAQIAAEHAASTSAAAALASKEDASKNEAASIPASHLAATPTKPEMVATVESSVSRPSILTPADAPSVAAASPSSRHSRVARADSSADSSRIAVSGESLTFANLPTIEDLSARLDLLQQSNDALDMEVRGLRAELARRDGESTRIASERDEALSRVATLERQLAGLRGDNAPSGHGNSEAPPQAIANAADNEEINRRALAAFERRDYVSAIKHFAEAADLGNASAMNNLAMMHARGYGVTASIDEAITHFERAAATGSDVAATNLANIYHYGRGIRVDHQRAIAWYKRARELGNKTAQDQIDLLTRADRMLALAGNP